MIERSSGEFDFEFHDAPHSVFSLCFCPALEETDWVGVVVV